MSEEIEMRLEKTFDADDVMGTRYAELQRWLNAAIAVSTLAKDEKEADAAVAASLRLICESFFKGGLTRERYSEHVAESWNAPAGTSAGLLVGKAVLIAAGMADWSIKLVNDER